MPRASVFTSCDDASSLDQSHTSLRSQTFGDWEWVVVCWGGARRWRPSQDDERVVLLTAEAVDGHAVAKRLACDQARGEYLVQLEAGDELEPSCLKEVVDTFDKRGNVGFVYSDSAVITDLGDDSPSEAAGVPGIREAPGFEYADTEIDGRTARSRRGLQPFPHNVAFARIVPYKVCGFRRSAYRGVGGYDSSRALLADEDLWCRLYEASRFAYLPSFLYLERNGAPTEETATPDLTLWRARAELYDTYIQRLSMAWAKREGLHCLDLGAAHNKPDGYLGVDQYPGPGVDLVADVTKGIDLPDSSVGVIRAADFLEHIPDKTALFNELYRLLAHGGMLLSLTPSTDGRGAFQDPTHVAYYNENSFWYFTDREYSAFVPEIKCRFQVSRVVTIAPSEWHREHRILYVNANLVALKDGPRQAGICLW